MELPKHHKPLYNPNVNYKSKLDDLILETQPRYKWHIIRYEILIGDIEYYVMRFHTNHKPVLNIMADPIDLRFYSPKVRGENHLFFETYSKVKRILLYRESKLKSPKKKRKNGIKQSTKGNKERGWINSESSK